MKCLNPYSIWHTNKYAKVQREKLYSVPCGKCIPCTINSRQDWIIRLRHEHRAAKSALFVTLTYAPKYCPDSVVKRHVQLFLKRLRKHDKTNRLRYFAVGEYGTKRQRPHYHLLLFNLENQELVRKSWKFGEVHIGNVTASSIAYCTKYIVQPEQKVYGKNPPFRLMSRGYGIGLAYLTDAMVNWHREDDRTYSIYEGQKTRLPRYYKNKIWYRHKDKERITKKNLEASAQQAQEELTYFQDKYGKQYAEIVMREFRDAHLARLKFKVSYTEKL